MSDSRASEKWACEYCTYENWPATKKCTLCRAPKPPQFIDEQVSCSEQDIYKIAPLICQDGDSNSGGVSLGPRIGGPVTSPDVPDPLDPGNKWPCQVCTFLNWARAVKCTQCLMARPKAVPVVMTTISTLATQPLCIDVNITTPAMTTRDVTAVTVTSSSAGGGTGGSRRGASPNSSSSPNSANSPEAGKAQNNDRNRAAPALRSPVPRSLAALAYGKWSCGSCTYENWPRSPKCVICGVARPKASPDGVAQSPSPTSSDPGSTRQLDNSDSVSPRGGHHGASQGHGQGQGQSQRQGSPPSSRSQENIALVGAMALPQQEGHGNQPDYNTNTSGHPRRPQQQQQQRVDGKKLRLLQSRMRELDLLWLSACQAVVEGDRRAVEAFIAAGGDPSRQLTPEECGILCRPSAFETGYTLVHLAIRFKREDMLATLLTATDVVTKAKKRVPAYVAPHVATEILRGVSATLRQRNGGFPCYFLTELSTFALPAEIDDLPMPIKKQLFAEILDQDVQKDLEEEEAVINWSVEVTERLGSRLFALWNRTAGDCLLDSVLQASWGVMDRDNTLRRALADSLCEGANLFYPRWKETEALQAESLHFSLDENQWQQDWAILLSLASQPGSSLEQVHIFALAHILRRPIIVYGIKYVKSFRGENIGLARFQGVYLPLLWDQSFCWKTPVALGYTRGHFSALVAMEVDMYESVGAGAHIDSGEEAQTAYLPLTDFEGKLLPLHFLTHLELGREEVLLREWLDCCVTEGGLLVARQELPPPHALVRQMLTEWMDRYRRLSQVKVTQKQQLQQQQQQQQQGAGSHLAGSRTPPRQGRPHSHVPPHPTQHPHLPPSAPPRTAAGCSPPVAPRAAPHSAPHPDPGDGALSSDDETDDE